MNVKDKISIEENHSIEWGNSTWAERENEIGKSIRNRYDREGGFNYAGSSEVPWDDFNLMIIQSIKRKHFSQDELRVILSQSQDFLLTNTQREEECKSLKKDKAFYQGGLDSVNKRMQELNCP